MTAFTKIAALLEQTVSELQRFLAIIDAERQALVSSDIDQLPLLAEQKSALATRLVHLESVRETMLSNAGLPPGRKGVVECLSANVAQSDAAAASATWQRLIQLAAETKRNNETNGKLIASRIQQNQQALNCLLGKAADIAPYGADGQQKIATGQRPLGSA